MELYLHNNGATEISFKFINWIKNGVCTAHFSLNFTCALVGHFAKEKGLRQGDPTSPCLFLLVMKASTQLFDHQSKARVFDYLSTCKELNVTRIIFLLMIYSCCV